MEYTREIASPVGKLLLSSDGESLTGLWIMGQKYFGATLDRDTEEKELPVFTETSQWLDSYFAGRRPDFCPPLAPKGSQFRQRVWRLLLEIPYGRLTTYGEIAVRLSESPDKPMSAQAVGGAVGHNPISIIIPCHRVVGAGGSLTGYAAGVAVKERLLRLEGAPMAGLKAPKKGTAL